MTDFYVNMPEVPNYVTAKQGVSSDALATGIAAAGDAVKTGWQVYGTVKSERAAAEMEAEFLKSLRGEDPEVQDEYSSASLREFSGKVDRFNQRVQLGRADNAEFKLEAEYRKRVKAEPWLADRYTAVKNRIQGEYQQTLKLIRQRDDEYQRNIKELQSKVDEKRYKLEQRVIDLVKFAEMGLDKPVEDYSTRELEIIVSKATIRGAAIAAADAEREAREEQRSIEAALRQEAGEARSVIEFDQNQLAILQDKSALADAAYERSNALTLITQLLETPGISPMEITKRVLVGIERAKSDFAGLRKGYATSATQIFMESMESLKDDMLDMQTLPEEIQMRRFRLLTLGDEREALDTMGRPATLLRAISKEGYALALGREQQAMAPTIQAGLRALNRPPAEVQKPLETRVGNFLGGSVAPEDIKAGVLFWKDMNMAGSAKIETYEAGLEIISNLARQDRIDQTSLDKIYQELAEQSSPNKLIKASPSLQYTSSIVDHYGAITGRWVEGVIQITPSLSKILAYDAQEGVIKIVGEATTGWMLTQANRIVASFDRLMDLEDLKGRPRNPEEVYVDVYSKYIVSVGEPDGSTSVGVVLDKYKEEAARAARAKTE